MRLPNPGSEIVLARDKYRNQIILHGNTHDGSDADGQFDLQTDGRVLLTPRFARELATKLLKFASAAEKRFKITEIKTREKVG